RPGQRAQIHLRAVMADAEEHAWRRRQRLRRFTSAADWQAHVARTRAAFEAALGPLPERTPLRVTTAGTLERRGYVVQKLLVETQPGFVATANLYLPARLTGKAPAVLHPVGHWQHSKAQDVEQARLVGLARKGYVGLIWDPLGQGERFQYLDQTTGLPWDAPSTQQHAAVCNPAMLVGSTVIATMLWDGVRLLDYLLSRPEVDAQRIGCTGVSGGGTYTMFLGAFDRRIRATVPVCSTSSLERKHRNGQIGEPCQDPIRAYPDMLDMADLLLAHAPAALRIIGTRYDFFPLAGLRDAFLDVQAGYEGLGLGERVDLQVVDAHHDYNREQRELMYAWFNRWLEHDAPVEEEPFTPEAPPTLWCTPTGQCLTAGVGRTAPDLVRELAQRLIPPPAPLATTADAERERRRVLGAAGRVLGPLPPLNGAPPQALEAASVGGLRVERLILEARMDVGLPALLFPPARDAADGGATAVAVLLDDRGKAPWSRRDGLAAALATAGLWVLAVDLRGWGETAWVSETFGWSQ
ncbi:MAG TPA: acetylxylan esterase, partial [Chloroflexota bacterium]|nr:acetylxylan esterase [Chloroflexota bacterium]